LKYDFEKIFLVAFAKKAGVEFVFKHELLFGTGWIDGLPIDISIVGSE